MTVRNKKRHEVVLDASSTIDSIAMTLNLFDNPEFANRILTSQFEAMSKMGLAEAPPREMLEVLIKTMSETVAPQIKKSIEKQLPIKRELYDAIYAVPLGKETLELPDGLNKLAPRATILDQAIRYSSLQGYVNLQSVQNLYVNQERRMASFDGSVRLENVKIDGKLTNAVVNTVGFIVAGDERAVLVVVVFLSTEPVATFKILEEMLSSLVFTA